MKQKWHDLFTLMEEAAKHPNRSTFAKKKRRAYNAANALGVLEVFFPVDQWGKWETIAEAEKHVSRSSFKESSPKAYAAMARNTMRGYSLLDYWFPRRAWRNKRLKPAYMPPMAQEDLDNMEWK